MFNTANYTIYEDDGDGRAQVELGYESESGGKAVLEKRGI
jgi:hypothetical protein